MNNQDSDTVMVPGVRAIAAIFAHTPKRLKKIWLHGKPGGRRAQLVAELEAAGILIEPARKVHLDHLMPDAAHQGIIAIVNAPTYANWRSLIHQPDALLLALDQVTDPRNFGAMLRSLEAFGGTGALVTRHRCARLGPTVTKTSAGASEIVPVAMETNLAAALGAARSRGVQTVVADLDGDHPETIDWTKPTVLVVGAEGAGVRQSIRAEADHVVTIPLSGQTASLNASVAVSILLYNAAQARMALKEAAKQKNDPEGV